MAGLFDTLSLGGFTLRNRIVLPPIATERADKEGRASEAQAAYYGRMAATGVAVVIVEHTAVIEEGRFSPHQLGAWSDEHVEGLSLVAKAIKDEGAVAILQLNHAGSKHLGEVRDIYPEGYGEDPLAYTLSVDQLGAIAKGFEAAASRAVAAGFDGVEVHGAHGFLLSSLLSPVTNKRNDDFGGNAARRAAFPLMVVRKVRAVVPEGKLVTYRLGATDMRDDGIGPDEVTSFAKRLLDEGVDVVNVSGGIAGSRPKLYKGTQGYFVPQAALIKEATGAVTVGVGGITDPEMAASFVAKGQVDLVAVGRAIVRDAKWVEEARAKVGS